jgi:hypothetical protein
MERRIRISALLVLIGLVVALVSLLIQHPLAFVMFIVLGATLIGIGVIYYLVSLVRVTTPETTTAPRGATGVDREITARDKA